jgi:hypothetical protein
MRQIPVFFINLYVDTKRAAVLADLALALRSGLECHRVQESLRGARSGRRREK